jgi:hypothetical protein
VFVAGDVARAPHPLFAYTFLALEHWGNAVTQARVAAHNMLSGETTRWPHLTVPEFWSTQFGHNIKSVGVPSFADQVAVVQGSVEDRRFVAAYGYRGRLTAAVTFNQAMWLEGPGRGTPRRSRPPTRWPAPRPRSGCWPRSSPTRLSPPTTRPSW